MPVKPNLKFIHIAHDTHKSYLLMGAKNPIFYVSRALNRKRMIKKLIHSELQYNDVLAIDSDRFAAQEAQVFKEELIKQLNISNPLNIRIEGEPDPKNEQELLLKANKHQEDILQKSHSILKKFSHLPYSIFLRPQKGALLSTEKTVIEIQNIDSALRTTQLFSAATLLVGVFILLLAVAVGSPFLSPFMGVAIGLTLTGVCLLSGSSAFGQKTGLFKNANQTTLLARDFVHNHAPIEKPRAIPDITPVKKPVSHKKHSVDATHQEPTYHPTKKRKSR